MLERLLPQIGEVLGGRYRIEKQLGMGGFGVVYKATQLSLDRTVAIKMLLPELLANDEAVQRFQREIDLARRLQHPNTVQLLDRGQTDQGLQFLVMEFLAGRDLGSVLEDEGPMSPARVQDVVSQVLGSLGEAHQRGVIHRDLKPPNIMMLEAYGRPDFAKVLDFGIARAIETSESPSAMVTRGVIGTPHYMSPEQCQGRRDLDGRSDLYSLGVMMIEMLTGKRPYEGSSALEVLVGHARPEPVPIPEPVAHGPLGPVIARVLSKDREQRYATAGDMLQDLRALDLRGAPVSGVMPTPQTFHTPQPYPPTPALPLPLTAPPPAGPAVRPPPSRKLAVILLVLVVAIGGVAAYWLATRGPGREPTLGTGSVAQGTGAGTGSPEVPDRPLSDGTYAFRDISWALAPVQPLPLVRIAESVATAGAPWFEVTIDGQRPVRVTERNAYDEAVRHLSLAYDDQGRSTGFESATALGYLEQRVVFRWQDGQTVDIQQQGRNHAWDGVGCPWVRLALDAAGRVGERICLDLDGAEVARWGNASRLVVESRDELGFPTRVSFRDPNGAPATARCSMARDRADTGLDCTLPTQAGPECHGLALESAPTGQLLRQSCLDASGSAPADTASVRLYERDALGNLLSLRFVDGQNFAQLGDDGWSEMRQTFAPSGSMEQTCWRDRAGRPVARGTEDQVACVRFAYDARGHTVRESAFDSSDAPAPFWPLGVHRIEYARDASGFATETRHYGVDLRPAGRASDGITTRRCRAQELGLEAECAVFNSADAPMLVDGHSRMTATYDERGNQLQRCHYDPQGRPAIAPVSGQGAVCIGFEYDEANRVTSVRFMDGSLNPTTNTFDRVHRFEFAYDEAGRRTQRLYRDERGRPVGRFGPVCGIGEERDGLNRLVAETVLDCQGRPFREITSGARIARTYDGRGRVETICHADVDGTPYRLRPFSDGSHPFAEGAACQRIEWDEQDRLVWVTFEDGSGNPVRGQAMTQPGITHTRAEYDGFGRMRRNYLYRDARTDAPAAVVDCEASGGCLVLDWFQPL